MNLSELRKSREKLRSELDLIEPQIERMEQAELIETIISDVKSKGHSIDPGYSDEIPGLQLWKLPYEVRASGWDPEPYHATMLYPLENLWAAKMKFETHSDDFEVGDDWTQVDSRFYGTATIWVPIYTVPSTEDGFYWVIDCDGDADSVEIKNGLVNGVDPIEDYDVLFIRTTEALFFGSGTENLGGK